MGAACRLKFELGADLRYHVGPRTRFPENFPGAPWTTAVYSEALTIALTHG